uniref:Uncharacterized protein n=1 Tax=Oryza glumipatula TaxID=40148 RepID=A0A0E0BNP6_9ORYZ
MQTLVCVQAQVHLRLVP